MFQVHPAAGRGLDKMLRVGRFHKKTAPGIPGTVLQEPYLMGDHKFAAFLLKVKALLLRTGDGHGKGARELEAEDLHEVLAIHTAQAVGQGHGTQGCSQCNKFINIQCGTEMDDKFLHNSPPVTVQAPGHRV